jgi:Holliday junction resolvase RusA-like endonuclease
MPDLCTHGRMVSQSCPGCGNLPASERERPLHVYRVDVKGFDFDHVLVRAVSPVAARAVSAREQSDAGFGTFVDGLNSIVRVRRWPAEDGYAPGKVGLLPARVLDPESLVYLVTIPGNPGACRVNARAKPIVREGSKHATIILTDGYKGWRSLAIACMRRAVASCPGPLLDLRAGPVEVRVTAYWPSKHAKGEAVGLAFGDVDAVAKACLDALKVSTPKKPGAGVITDDSQVVALTCTKAHDKRNPRIEIEVRRANG